MKTLISLSSVALICFSTLALADTNQSEAYYRKGLNLEKSGNPSAALTAYNAALRLNPQHANARYRAGQVKINAAAIQSSATEAKIGSVIIPTYQIEDATISEAISLLGLAIEKASNQEITPNLIVSDPNQKLTTRKITIQLKNVPVKAILDCIHNQAATKARFDTHAIVITPL
jgi:tetratricopeptide (TPR) repeat protein